MEHENDKIDHQAQYESNSNGSNGANMVGDGGALSRSVTVTMSNDQYERMFFQPTPPRRGDLAKRLGNPTLLGLLCFLIPYSSTIFILCGLHGSVAPYSLIGLTGDYYFIGVIGMVLAGIAEFVLGNSFPMAVFIVYGCHWGALAYAQDPFYALNASLGAYGGPDGIIYESSQGFHNIVMCLVSFIFLIGTIRVNVFFVLTFFGLVMLFAFIAAADFAVPHIKTAEQLAHVGTLLNIAGGFGFLGVICGWYLAITAVCEAVGLPMPLPILDLSTKVFPPKNNVMNRDLNSNNMKDIEKNA